MTFVPLRSGATAPLIAYLDGTEAPVVLDGSATLEAEGVYRCPIATKAITDLSLQWQQTAAGVGLVASHRFLISNSNDVELGELGRPDIWSDVTSSYSFATLPAAEGSEHYPIANVCGAWMILELTVAAGDDLTGVSVLAHASVRR